MAAGLISRRIAYPLSLLLLLGGSCFGLQCFPEKCFSVCKSGSDFMSPLPPQPVGTESRITQWGIVALNQVKDNLGSSSPPGVGRALAIFSTCIYEAAALFDQNMSPWVANEMKKMAGGDPRRVEAAVDGAAFIALKTIFAGKQSLWKVDNFMKSIADSEGEEAVKAFIINFRKDEGKALTRLIQTVESKQLSNKLAMQAGSMACEKVIKKFTADGYDGLGNPLSGTSPFPFTSVNFPQERAGITNCVAQIKDLDQWQPLCVPNTSNTLGNIGTKDCTPQKWLAPSAGGWTTFAIPRATPKDGQDLIATVARANSGVMGGPPSASRESDREQQLTEVLAASAALDDPRKMVAEFWADGPDTTAPPGTWFLIALNALEANKLKPKGAARLLLLVGNALNDAGVASWRVKLTYNSMRPISMIQCDYSRTPDTYVKSWKGPYQGVGFLKGTKWQPYQQHDFVTPPFAGYVSGHSTFSFAASEVLRLFFGSDNFVGPKCQLFREGSSSFERKIVAGQAGHVSGVTDKPNTGKESVGYSPRSDVYLCWETFSEAANQASESRIYGGIHVRADANDGDALGKETGRATYIKGMKLFGKSANGNVQSVF